MVRCQIWSFFQVCLPFINPKLLALEGAALNISRALRQLCAAKSCFRCSCNNPDCISDGNIIKEVNFFKITRHLVSCLITKGQICPNFAKLTSKQSGAALFDSTKPCSTEVKTLKCDFKLIFKPGELKWWPPHQRCIRTNASNFHLLFPKTKHCDNALKFWLKSEMSVESDPTSFSVGKYTSPFVKVESTASSISLPAFSFLFALNRISSVTLHHKKCLFLSWRWPLSIRRYWYNWYSVIFALYMISYS